MILKDVDLDNVVKITVIETYINHVVPSDTISDLDIERYRILIGRILSDQRLLTNCKLALAVRGHDVNVEDRCANLRDQIAQSIERLPSLVELETCNLSCSKDVFLEILIMAIKNSSLSHQHNFFKIKNAKRVSLEKKFTELRMNFNANSGEIFRTERDLNNIIELDLREEIVKMKNFEKLSNEKITPYFLSLAKRSHNSECLSDINRDDGTPFDNTKQRSDYIVDYYASTYRRQVTVIPNNAIHEFLGDTADIPVVTGSKLNNDE
jgi:hypothetical protein